MFGWCLLVWMVFGWRFGSVLVTLLVASFIAACSALVDGLLVVIVGFRGLVLLLFDFADLMSLFTCWFTDLGFVAICCGWLLIAYRLISGWLLLLTSFR